MLESRLFSENMECSAETERLYNASFPDNERIPWHRLKSMLGETRRMYVYFDEGRFIGLSYVFIHQSVAYLGYLAVEEDLRDQGYGTRILRAIQKELHAYKIVIDIETVDENADNYEERRKRREFYLRNGFVSTGTAYYFYHVDYELLSFGGIVTAEEYRNLILEHWGPIAQSAVFRSIDIS